MPRVSNVRIAPDNQTVLAQLGLLADLAGTWIGKGFNLIARPNFHDQTDLYLQLNQTRETLRFEPIGSAIPNRGFGQDDIELHGLTYLQKITDAALAGLWDVDDRSTADLMKDMYVSIRHGKPPSQALREAQLALVRSAGSYRKPYYWAPFEVFADKVD